MATTLKPHIVRAGDTPLRLSVIYDVPIATIADHPKNQALADHFTRHCLPVGVTVEIPIEPKTLSVSPGSKNAFKATVPMHRVSILFEDGTGPLANAEYELEGLLPEPIEDKLDPSGVFERDVPLFVDKLTIRFPKRHVEHVIWVGQLAPPEQDLGCEARLMHLGYLPIGQLEGDPFTFADKEAQSRAITSMQEAFGLAKTGFADAATLRDVCERHGEAAWK